MSSETQCRVCMASTNDLQFSNFDEKHELNTLGEMFFEITQISIDSSQDILCIDCRLQLLQAHQFRVKAIAADAVLQREKEATNIKIELEISDILALSPAASEPKSEIWDPEEETEPVKVKKPPKLRYLNFCNICLKRFPRAKESRACQMEHIQQNQGFDCAVCEAKMKSRDALKRHMRYHIWKAKGLRYICDFCHQTFSQKHSMITHFQRQHAMENSAFHFVCFKCGKICVSKINLNKHLNNVHREKTETCEVCKKTLKTKKSLKVHMKLHEGIKNFTCEICSLSFTAKGNMLAHQVVHSEERPFPCTFPSCSATFKSQRHLKLHRVIHYGLHKFSCGFCPLKFQRRDNLRAHLQVHQENRAFRCSQCDHVSKTKALLRKHERKHSGDMLVCAFCPKTFYTDSERRKHQLLKHHGGTLKCSQCETEFHTNYALAKHRRSECRMLQGRK